MDLDSTPYDGWKAWSLDGTGKPRLLLINEPFPDSSIWPKGGVAELSAKRKSAHPQLSWQAGDTFEESSSRRLQCHYCSRVPRVVRNSNLRFSVTRFGRISARLTYPLEFHILIRKRCHVSFTPTNTYLIRIPIQLFLGASNT